MTRCAVIAFLIGILILQQFPSLPEASWSLLLLISLPLSFVFVPLRIPLWCLNGFLYALWIASSSLSTVLPESLAGKDLLVEGVISSIPEQARFGQRFEFEPQYWPEMKSGIVLPTKIRLNEYGAVANLKVGQRWRFRVRLKPPHGFVNPGGFDYEGWLFRKQIRATGYVRDDSENRLLGESQSPGFWLYRQRKNLADGIDNLMPDSPYRGLVKALTVGMRGDISDEQWQLLLRSGTNHLMAISGLHVGIVAGLAFFLMRGLWRCSARLVLLLPAPQAAAVAAILFALTYAALAGFSVPTQRALIMVTAFMLAIMMRRFCRPLDGLLLALFLVLLVDPLAVMDAGFWLSFVAVTFILFGMAGRLYMTSLWWRWGRVHLLLAIALLPFTLLLFDKASLISPLANFVAVPLVSLIVVPLVLLATAFLSIWPALSELLLQGADLVFSGLWPLLTWLVAWPVAYLNYAMVSPWLMIPALIGVIWLLAPSGWPARWLGLVWVSAVFLIPHPRPENGEAWFTLLDVGQGLAAVVQTRNHVLVFDTGPRFSESFDTGSAVVAPFLVQAGWQQVDLLIVSHADNDHIGGAESLLSQLSVKELYSSELDRLSRYEPQLCHVGQKWQWDGIQFEMLHPSPGRRESENNASCVLRISNDRGTILLTGDVELAAERYLLASAKQKLRADLLVVPHHGSKTSSSKEFIAAVAPRLALFPVGYRNRFGLPRQEIVDRYTETGAVLMFSGYDGAIELVLGEDGLSDPRRFRIENRYYWNHIPKQGWSVSEK